MNEDEPSPIIISISTNATNQLDAVESSKSLYSWASKPCILAQIQKHIAMWTPRSERGGSGVIKWCEQISIYCNADIYRLKSIEDIDQWRVFFFLLDLDTPPTRHVEEIIECQSNEQCYDDMTQPHVVRLLKAITRFKIANRLRLMR